METPQKSRTSALLLHPSDRWEASDLPKAIQANYSHNSHSVRCCNLGDKQHGQLCRSLTHFCLAGRCLTCLYLLHRFPCYLSSFQLPGHPSVPSPRYYLPASMKGLCGCDFPKELLQEPDAHCSSTECVSLPVLAGQELPAKSRPKERPQQGGPVIPCQGLNPRPIKCLGIIKHFLFVKYFIVIFIASFY